MKHTGRTYPRYETDCGFSFCSWYGGHCGFLSFSSYRYAAFILPLINLDSWSYCDCTEGTIIVGTKKGKTNYKSSIHVAQARSFPQPSVNQGNEREYKRLLSNEGKVAVLCLNASHGTAAHERLVAIHRKLGELRAGRSELKQISKDIDAEMFPQKMAGPGRAGTRRHKQLAAKFKTRFQDLDQQQIALNELLARYAFRPCVSYIFVSDEWRPGLVPDTNQRFFQTKVGQFTVTEADAAMSLVRLDANGKLHKVRLCKMCRARWLYGRTIDKYCCDACRDEDRRNSPDYHERKAEAQRKYREGLERGKAAGAYGFKWKGTR